LGEAEGCIKGFSMGSVWVFGTEYGPPGVHEDQEGFYVVSGEGYVKIQGREFSLSPGMFFLVKAGESHCMRRSSTEPLRAIWAHGPIT
jgi:mannose-6-phosphate isomerase-like protein (cupin superfamily)